MKLVSRTMTTNDLQNHLHEIEGKLDGFYQMPTTERDLLMREKARIQAILKERKVKT